MMRHSLPQARWLFAVLLLLALSVGLVSVTTAQSGSTCGPNALPSRLAPGQRGQIAAAFSTLRDAPAGVPVRVMFAPATFTVMAGPTCAGGLAYFDIDYGSVRGWALESQRESEFGADRYWLAPLSPTPTATLVGPTPTATPILPTRVPPTVTPVPAPDCSLSLPTRLTIGRTGSIVERFSSLRSAPGGAVIRVVFAPATFTVVSGPSCLNGFAFWEIDYGGGSRGWALESQRTSEYGPDRYWLQP